MIAVIRIRGLVGVRKDMERTLDLLKLKKKYSCVLVENKREIAGMLEKVKSFISYSSFIIFNFLPFS